MRTERAESCAPRGRISFRDEGGQSLILITAAMFAIIAIAALGIDVAGWYQQRHQAQVAADAAALAAANYMGNTSGATASTGTNTATSMASTNMNGATIDPSNVTINTSNKTVTVIVPTTGSIVFAGIGGISGPAISAKAVASWARTDCTTAGTRCAFIFAKDNVCSGTTGITDPYNKQGQTQQPIGHGVQVIVAGQSGSPEGAMISNSNFSTSTNAHPSWSANAVYSNQTGCSADSGTTAPSPYQTVTTEAPLTSWPVDYSTIYPACPGTSTLFGPVTCDTNGFPSYCTAAVESTGNITNPPTANDVYCASGSGSTTSAINHDPSQWTGSITQTAGLNATYLGGSFSDSYSGNVASGPAACSSIPGCPSGGTNRLFVYAAESNAYDVAHNSTNPAVQIATNGTTAVSGDVFVPTGTIDCQIGGTPSGAGIFLEGWDVAYNSNGNVLAGGPSTNDLGQFLGDQLTG